MTHPTVPAYAIELKGITKSFGANRANDQVHLKVAPGEILALVGENGAGKTTLMNLLYGLLQPDSGQILIQGKPVRCTSPSVAISHGIGMVHQHFMLIPPFSVTENVILGSEPIKSYPFIDYHQAKERVLKVARQYGFDLNPDALAGTLGVGTEQRIEIIKTLYREASIFILDEPTAVLTPQETDELFDVLRQFKAEGKTIIFISHKLDEVLAISDRISVMKAGRIAGELVTSSATKAEIARMMVGREVLLQVEKNPAVPGEPVLEITDLKVPHTKKKYAVNGVSLTIRKGEILGIAGVEGNGQSELIDAITGLRKVESGSICLQQKNINLLSPRERFISGLAHIPEDRLKRGLITEFTIQENLILGRHHEPQFSSQWSLHNKNIKTMCHTLVTDFDIRPPNASLLCRQLSGGNQQKVIIARELSRNPVCLIASQPTRGVDIGAIEFIHRQIIRARDSGVAVLLVSADLSEILSLSDRIAVMYNGTIMGIVDADKTNERQLGLMMTGSRINTN